MGIATVSTHGINPAIYPNLPFDGEKDFTPVSNLAAVPNIMTVNPKVPARNIADFIKLAKSEPGKLTYASAGNGSVSHMMGELFKMASGANLMHVPYRGVGPALNDALAGQVDVLYDNLPSTLPHAQSGRLVPLAVAWPKRVASLPDVPTFAEAGLPAVNDASWFGLVAPAAAPAGAGQAQCRRAQGQRRSGRQGQARSAGRRARRQLPGRIRRADLGRDRQEQAHRQRSQREDRLSPSHGLRSSAPRPVSRRARVSDQRT